MDEAGLSEIRITIERGAEDAPIPPAKTGILADAGARVARSFRKAMAWFGRQAAREIRNHPAETAAAAAASGVMLAIAFAPRRRKKKGGSAASTGSQTGSAQQD